MAKTNQPLLIIAHDSLVGTPEVNALIEKGHSVCAMDMEDKADLILGPNCWRMTPELLKYLPLALKGARGKKRAAKAAAKVPSTPVG